jgi:hypothetical protein
MRLNALPASCAVPMANHSRVRSAMAMSAHAQTKLAHSAATMTANHAGLIVSSCGDAENNLRRLGYRM